ncbi:MAG: hypothetical protein R2818_02930 [Flavobacteriales bacterium]
MTAGEFALASDIQDEGAFIDEFCNVNSGAEAEKERSMFIGK